MGTRRQSRICALQLLFQWDIHHSTEHWLADYWTQHPAVPEVREFAEQLVEGVMDRQKELDALIGKLATNWKVPRMPIVDRSILRMGLYELLWLPDVPAKVTVSEAIELAKQFADDETRKFVNGILDKVLRDDPRLEGKRAELAEAGK
ncbi:MAG: transcription antitermination factor NusB [Nitrospira sp.]|nr:transcription antitermination factor NusB [Nitrospira sp.]